MSNTRKSFYSTLGLERSARPDEIKKAYHGLMKKFHPDKYHGNPEIAAAMTTELVEAYEVLSDAELRKKYDLLGYSGDDTYQRSQKARNPEAPLDKYFSFDTFISTLGAMLWTRNNEAIAKYFDDSLNDLEATITQPVFIRRICATLNNQTYYLITHFNADWLKRLPDFGRAEFLGPYLNQLPCEHWQAFLDHIGKIWVHSQLNGQVLKTLMGYFTGPKEINSNKAREHQRETFCNYLGLDWLRMAFDMPEQLGNFLSDSNFHMSHNQMLTFINGDDHWLQSTYQDPARIGLLLTTMASYEEPLGLRMPSLFGQPAQVYTLTTDVKDKWKLLSSYLTPNLFKKIADNPATLNALISQMENEFRLPPRTKKIELFLQMYFESESINEIEQLVALFNTHALAAEKETLMAKSMVLIGAFSSQQLKKAFLELRDFPTLLAIIDNYKHEIWYRALLFGVSKAVQQDREDNTAAYTSMFGAFFGYSREQKLAAGVSLINSILLNSDLQDVPGMTDGELGQLSKRYTESRTPKETQNIRASMLM
jgi:curved DNA-binding protein CbpA